jgi:hypothetical protein
VTPACFIQCRYCTRLPHTSNNIRESIMDDDKIKLMMEVLQQIARPLDKVGRRDLDALMERYRLAPGDGKCGRCAGTMERRPAVSRRGRGEICALCGFAEAFGG